MQKWLSLPLAVVIFITAIVVSGAIYIVDETQQAVITQFGEPIGDPVTKAGLYFKIPFIQVVSYFDKRILIWDGDPNQIPTLDKRYIWVDATARWRITDALKFRQSVGTEAGAQSRLDDIIDSATRDTISSAILVEAIRNSNRLVGVNPDDDDIDRDSGDRVQLESIQFGREQLTRDIVKRSREMVPSYGIELIDVRIKRIGYVKDVQLKVFERMISERNRAAEQFRSEGQGKKAEIEGQKGKELKQIRSEAYRKSQEIKGKADAEAINIYAEAYNKDPEFYSFMKTLETYRETINDKNILILSTDSDFYKYLKTIDQTQQP